MTSSPKTGSSKTRAVRKDGTFESIVFSGCSDDDGGNDDEGDDDDDDESKDATNLGGPPNTSS